MTLAALSMAYLVTSILECKMNFKVALIALGLAGALVGTVQAADESISKKITLTAQINDGLFVS